MLKVQEHSGRMSCCNLMSLKQDSNQSIWCVYTCMQLSCLTLVRFAWDFTETQCIAGCNVTAFWWTSLIRGCFLLTYLFCCGHVDAEI